MAGINQPSGSTFKSTTIENLLLEVLTYSQQYESTPTNRINSDSVQVSLNLNQNTFTATFSIDASQSLNDSGQPVLTAKGDLAIDIQNSGSGTFKSTKLAQYILEIITYTQILEATKTKNPQDVNRVSASYIADDEKFSGTVSLPISYEINSQGKIEIKSVEYLMS